MKATGRIYLLITMMLVAASCGYDSFGDMASSSNEYVAPNMRIGDMIAMYDKGVENITADMIIAGIVTANDRSNNFYRTFIIDDGTGAVEVNAGIFDLHNIFIYGRRIAVKARGLAVAKYDGILQMGFRSSGSGGSYVDYITSRYIRGYYLFPQDEYEVVEPVDTNVGALTEAMCGRLVRIDGLRLLDESGDDVYWSPPGWEGMLLDVHRMFEEGDGGPVVSVVTSGYADFAMEPVPTGEISITGIVMKVRTDMYTIKLRSLEDVVEM